MARSTEFWQVTERMEEIGQNDKGMGKVQADRIREIEKRHPIKKKDRWTTQFKIKINDEF